MQIKTCFLGGARYSKPLDLTAHKKFRALSALGEIYVIGFSTDLRPHRFTEIAHFYLLPKLPLPMLRYLEFFFVGQLIVIWLCLRRGVNVLIAQSPYEALVAACCLKVGSWFGRKPGLVVEAHGDFENSLFSYRKIHLGKLYRFVMNNVALCSLRRADVVRAISVSTREQLQRWVPAKPIVQFPTWTDIEVFLQYGVDNNLTRRPVVLFVGVLVPLKGVHHLIKAFSAISGSSPEAQLIIAGKDDNRQYAASLKRQVAELGLQSRVQFVGSQPQSELAKMMAQASVLVLPSSSEGLGRVVIEAMATGTPVIGSRVGGIPDLISDGVNGFLIPPGGDQALAEKLGWLLEHPTHARAMGVSAHRFATQFFSTETYVKGYRRMLELSAPVLPREQHASVTL